ncbi:hypothetical protein [Neomegalonema sp.]|uniref:hypothetical protein n=1 Tax=Neomegalonema sp. TaxID=2039713 RepID=UPI002613F8F0|nr:hypothetical protein [Neomegalonema sp.]MDD2870070.1 hypothetical protein [Neomegalonema sp.]
MRYEIDGRIYPGVREARAAGHDEAAILAAWRAGRRAQALTALRARIDLAASPAERETVVSDGHALTRLALTVVAAALAEAGSATLRAAIGSKSAALGFDALGLAQAEYAGHELAVAHLRAGGSVDDLPEGAICPPVLLKTAASDAETRLARGRAVDAALSRAYASYVQTSALLDAETPDLDAIAAEEVAAEAAALAPPPVEEPAAPPPLDDDMPDLDLAPPAESGEL